MIGLRRLALLLAPEVQAQEPPPPPVIGADREVPVDWALKPDGLEAGDRFRLVFLSSRERNAESTNISDYNSFVQGNAGHRLFVSR